MTETEIPEDIMQAAETVYNELGRTPVSWEPIARALLAERRRHTVEAQPVPEGWQLVPKEPTNKMTHVGQSLRYDAINSIGEIYRQMLSAAPTPPSRAEVTGEWQPIETAPKDKTRVLVAVPDKDFDGYTVGEAYFDPEHYGDGDWWWAGNDHGDYHGGPISDIMWHEPSHWMPLPAGPALGAGKKEGE